MQRDISKRQWVGYLGLTAVIILFGGYMASNRPSPAVAPVKFVDAPAPAAAETTRPSATSTPAAIPEAQNEIVVHATGSVKVHGILHMPPNSRVADAIKRAGGATADADLDSINLAAKLVDGTQLHVPSKNPSMAIAAVDPIYKGGTSDAYLSQPKASSSSAATASGGGGEKKSPAGPVSLNTATAGQLQSLPGVGPSTAQKILQYRQEHGGFSSVDELLAVKGIGPKKMKDMRKFLRL